MRWLVLIACLGMVAISARAEQPPRAQPLPMPVRGRPPLRRIPPPMERPRVHGDAGAPLLLGLGGTLKWHHDRGYELLSEQGLRRKGGLELFAAYDVWQPHPRLILSVGGTYRVTGGARLRAMDYAEHELLADVALRLRALSWLSPQLRVSGGLVSTRVALTDRASDVEQAAHDRDVTSSLAAGVFVHTPSRTFENHRGRRASLVLGMLVEGGCVFAPPARLRTAPSDESGLEHGGLSLGTLTRTAPTLRVAGFLRF